MYPNEHEKQRAILKKANETMKEATNRFRRHNELFEEILKRFEKDSIDEFITTILRTDENKTVVFIDKIFLEQIDRDVESGKFRDRTQAVESIFAEKMKKNSS